MRALLLAILMVAVIVTPADSQDLPPVTEALRAGMEAPRAIRRDIPLTDAIRKAFAEGTRDFTGRPGDNYWQLQTDYTIRVSLDPATQTLAGTESVLIHNNSSDELTVILLRLDHNIFRPLVPRGTSVPAENTDGMVLTRVTVDGQEVDLHARRQVIRRGGPRPSSGLGIRGMGQTLAQISLQEPVPAGETVTLEIDWHTALPGGPNGRAHRMTQRWESELFQPTQWYPRVAKYDDLRGWDTSTYLGPAEFYNNFGRFDVSIDVPAGWIVSGTGVLQNGEEVLTESARERLSAVLDSDDIVTIVSEDEQKTAEGTSLVWHFVADEVNDFAWATSNNFIWQALRANIPEKGPIPIHMLYLPRRAHLFENAGELSRHALEFYSALWAPYPFPQLTLQDGPSAGMEYPMVINSNQGAADHEVAHQWWPMMVGTNETWYGWMDEGFNSYMNILSAADRRGEPANLNGVGQSYGLVSGSETEAPLMWAANYGGQGYGYQAYRKAPPMLSMLGGIVGDEAVQQAMSNYTKAWSFKHPSPWDFAFFMTNELGVDLGWFWYYWLWTTESVDGSIQDVSTTGGMTQVTVRQKGQMPAPVVLKVTFTDDSSETMSWPVDVWFEGSRTFVAEFEGDGREVKSVVLDPSCRFPDGDTTDNAWPRDADDGMCGR